MTRANKGGVRLVGAVAGLIVVVSNGVLIAMHTTVPVEIKYMVSVMLVGMWALIERQDRESEASAGVVRFWFYGSAALLMVYLLFKYVEEPMVWSCVLLVLVLSLWTLSGARKLYLAGIHAVAVLLAVGVAEAYVGGLTPLNRPSTKLVYSVVDIGKENTNRYVRKDRFLGYKILPEIQVRERKTKGDRVVFDQVYRINEAGWRANRRKAVSACEAMLIMGGSFVFGEGVGDAETVVAQVEVQSGGRIKVLHVSAPGYGAHQVLAALENDLEPVDKAVPMSLGAYIAIGDHVRRAAGLAPWDLHGPRYELAGDDKVRYQAPFDASPFQKAVRLTFKSHLVRAFLPRLVGEYDYKRYAVIVDRARQLFEKRYHAPFVVVYWGRESDDVDRKTIEVLRSRGLEVVTMGRIIPGFERNYKDYVIPDDEHPSARAYRMLAGYLAGRVNGCDAPFAGAEPTGKVAPETRS